jgi:hypothetical protein
VVLPIGHPRAAKRNVPITSLMAFVPLAGVDEHMALLIVQRVNRRSIVVDNFLRLIRPLRRQKPQISVMADAVPAGGAIRLTA